MQNFIYNLKNSYLLFLTAMIWGLTFLFQKTAMENLDPYYFTGFRFLLGTLVLFPFFYRRFFKLEKKRKIQNNAIRKCSWNYFIWRNYFTANRSGLLYREQSIFYNYTLYLSSSSCEFIF